MIKLSIHPVFFLVILLAFIYGFIFEVLLLFLIVLIHELGHACTALYFGWRVKKIELLPFGGVAEVYEHGNRPLKEEALVMIAGPLMNVLLIGMAYSLYALGWWQGEFVYLFIDYNLVLLFFNLLPIWPLDGGKLLQIGLCLVYAYKQAMKKSLLFSTLFLCLYFLSVYTYYPTYFYLWVVGIFIAVSIFQEHKKIHYQFLRFLLYRYRAKQSLSYLQLKTIRVQPTLKVTEALALMCRHKYHYFCIRNDEGVTECVLPEKDILHYFFHQQKTSSAVSEILR